MARIRSISPGVSPQTFEGAPAAIISPEDQLRRLVLSSLLWEDSFYVDGKSAADLISEAAKKVDPAILAALAIEARNEFHLRHVPLLLLDALSATGRGNSYVSTAISLTIGRVDEIPELLAIYWRNGRKMVPAQMRKGLARAFGRFDEYALAKYDRAGPVKLRDALRILRPKPEDEQRSALYRRLKEGKLAIPDTWEVELSRGADKRETFERLMKQGKLGYLALLRNLRNMAEAGVDRDLIINNIIARKGAHKVLPFRFIAAARAAPQFEPALDRALLASIDEGYRFAGKTIVLVDVSGSMVWDKLSAKSDLRRVDVAAALASVVNGDDIRVFCFTERTWEVPARRGMAGVQAIANGAGGGTMLGNAIRRVNQEPHDRLIVVTDEQSGDAFVKPIAKRAYIINVGSNKNGVGYGGNIVHIDGFSESVLRFIHEYERELEPKPVQHVAYRGSDPTEPSRREYASRANRRAA